MIESPIYVLPTLKDIAIEFAIPAIIVSVVLCLLYMAFGIPDRKSDTDRFMIDILETMKDKFKDDIDYPGKYVRSEFEAMIKRFEQK